MSLMMFDVCPLFWRKSKSWCGHPQHFHMFFLQIHVVYIGDAFPATHGLHMTAVGEQRGGVLLGRYRCCTVMLKRHLQMPSSAVAWRRRNFGLWTFGFQVCMSTTFRCGSGWLHGIFSRPDFLWRNAERRRYNRKVVSTSDQNISCLWIGVSTAQRNVTYTYTYVYSHMKNFCPFLCRMPPTIRFWVTGARSMELSENLSCRFGKS